MVWAATAVGVGSAVVGGVMKSNANKSAARQQEHAEKRQEAILGISADQVQGYATEYTEFLTKLDEDFDPYDVEDAFNSLYEGVIQPMERDFDENVLPGIQAAYSGGVMGQGAGLSGASSSAEATARRDLSEQKASLRYAERGDAINRNFQEFDRRANVGAVKFGAETVSPMLRANNAQTNYGARTDSIAATLATKQGQASAISDFGSLGMSALNLKQQGDYNDSLNSLLKGRIGTGADTNPLTKKLSAVPVTSSGPVG